MVKLSGSTVATTGCRPLGGAVARHGHAFGGSAEFFAANAPEGVELDELSVLGPIFVLKLKWSPSEFGRPLVAELWLYPDGSRILELSTKCTTTEAMQVAAEARAFLQQKGVDLSGEQQTKTKTALEFFAKELTAESA
jgi:hypothetical protein